MQIQQQGWAEPRLFVKSPQSQFYPQSIRILFCKLVSVCEAIHAKNSFNEAGYRLVPSPALENAVHQQSEAWRLIAGADHLFWRVVISGNELWFFLQDLDLQCAEMMEDCRTSNITYRA